jgi:hypothetical protein
MYIRRHALLEEVTISIVHSGWVDAIVWDERDNRPDAFVSL